MGLDMYLMRVKDTDEYFNLEKRLNELDKEIDSIWKKYIEIFKEHFKDDCNKFFNSLKEKYNIQCHSDETDVFETFIRKIAEFYRLYDNGGDIDLEDLKWYLFNYYPCMSIDGSEEKEEEFVKEISEFVKRLPLKTDLENLIKILEKKFDEYDKIDNEQKSLVLDNEAIYWRKANQIYNFFISLDKKALNCQPIKVTIDDLKVLKEKCEEAMEAYERGEKDKILKILPSREGFFFGSTEICDCYYENLKYTKEKIEKLLENYPDSEYIFSASW